MAWREVLRLVQHFPIRTPADLDKQPSWPLLAAMHRYKERTLAFPRLSSMKVVEAVFLLASNALLTVQLRLLTKDMIPETILRESFRSPTSLTRFTSV